MERIIGKKKKEAIFNDSYYMQISVTLQRHEKQCIWSKGKKVITKLFTSLTNVYVWLILLQETIYFYGHLWIHKW